jgi:hypothetical protein
VQILIFRKKKKRNRFIITYFFHTFRDIANFCFVYDSRNFIFCTLSKLARKKLWRKRESKRINDYIQREIDEEKKKRRFGDEMDKFKRIEERAPKE